MSVQFPPAQYRNVFLSLFLLLIFFWEYNVAFNYPSWCNIWCDGNWNIAPNHIIYDVICACKNALRTKTWLSSENGTGYNCHWNFFLAASMGDREERTTFHINVHSVGTDYNSNFLSILVERNPSLGKV